MKKRIIGFLLAIISLSIVSCSKSPVLYLVGDSTCATKDPKKFPETGWGQVLPEYFSPDLKIENHAQNGRSTRSFIYEGRWDSVMSKLNAGDYVVVQFGHNDGVESKHTRWCTLEEYRYNLTKFIKEVQSKGAEIILCTSIERRKFDSTGVLTDTHGEYPGVVRELAEEYNLTLIDMQKKSNTLINGYGEEKSKDLFLHLEPGEYENFPDGRTDDTHFSELGAKQMAGLFVEGIKEQNHELAKYLIPE